MLSSHHSLLSGPDDAQLFDKLYAQYYPMSHSAALRMLDDPCNADETVESAWDTIARYFQLAKDYLSEAEHVFTTWLVANVALAAKSRNAELPRDKYDFDADELTGFECLVRRALIEMTQMEFGELFEGGDGSDYIRVLEERLSCGYSFRDIGESLGCSADDAQSRYNQAVEELIKRMEE